MILFSKHIKATLLLLICSWAIQAQEHTGPLLRNIRSTKKSKQLAQKTTALSLPFFEDFTTYSQFPDETKWADNQVYINNTMCVQPISRGVATFDALNPLGLPWYPDNNASHLYCDSLTSKTIDLSSYTSADSLYLSFFYQPQGNGYYPALGDSLILFFRVKVGDNWKAVWKKEGTTLQSFTQVMVPVNDTLFLHSNFQFRFVNIAALNYADANWNIDYIKLDANRNLFDTAIQDIAFTSNPTFLLNDYTSMPYRQFYPFATGERSSIIVDSIRNITPNIETITHGFNAVDEASGTTLQSTTTATFSINNYSTVGRNNTTYSTLVSPGGIYDRVTFKNTFYIESTASTGPTNNDTIVKHQIFDNYLSYDDGSAEQSYYLTLFPSLPAKFAIEHHLNVPDTIKGMAIYFGRQVPNPVNKIFTLAIYKKLAGVDGAIADDTIHLEELFTPGYEDTINHFWYYKFNKSIPLPAGTFYAAAIIPAESGSDSLYFGLDMNRIGGNHTYYNVLGYWTPSLINGAIMMRPLLGKDFIASSVQQTPIPSVTNIDIYPNPSYNEITIKNNTNKKVSYTIKSTVGNTVYSNTINNTTDKIDISTWPIGNYWIEFYQDGVTTIKTITKL